MTSLDTLARNMVWLEIRDGYPSKSRQDVKKRMRRVITAEYGEAGVGLFTWIQILYYVWKIWRLLQKRGEPGGFDALDSFAELPSESVRSIQKDD